MVIQSLLSRNSNKRLQNKKSEVKKVKIILSILTTILIMLIMILIVLAMSLIMFILLNFVGLPRLNRILVILSSRFTKISKKKLNLLLMWLNVTRFFMNYIRLATLKCLILYLLYMS
jgi:flagellar basal body-associated protein FliL